MNDVDQVSGAGVDAAAQALRSAFDAPVYVPGEDGYETARLPWRRIVDLKPAVIAEASGPEDVRTAILTAREQGLPFAVQSSGHGWLSPVDGGVLLKTSRLAEVKIDPERQIATVGSGVIWNAVIDAADPLGLAPLSGAFPSVGVAGYTLGGGSGLLGRKYGWAADSLLRAQLVTADGSIITASATEHPDLFWALRGGSGNFGVVTELEFRLYPVARVTTGLLVFPFDRTTDLMARYREWAPTVPDEMNSVLALQKMPPAPQLPEPLRGKWVIQVRAVYVGEDEEAGRLLAPLREAGGAPLMEMLKTTTYGENRTLGGPPAQPQALRTESELFQEISDEVISVIVDAAGAPGSPLSLIEAKHWEGALGREGEDTGAAGHRDVPFSVAVETVLGGPVDPVAANAYVDGVLERLRPYATGGSALNFLSDTTRTETAFSPKNYERLRTVKKTYDSDNFFRANHNIPPAP